MLKNNIYTKLFILFALSYSVQSKGQVAPERVDFLSPNVADFIKYGNITPSLYTGQIGLNIPIIEAKDSKFTVPVSLGYNSAGFKPNVPSGPEGMNWYLSAGGSITRKINGEADDCQGRNVSSCNGGCSPGVETLIGFYIGATSNPISKSSAFSFASPPGSANSTSKWWYMGYDYQPDEFSFSFMGHSGKFFVNNDGTVTVMSEEHIAVNLSGFTIQPVSPGAMTPSPSQIILTTPDGYKYYFGGASNLSDLEYSVTADGSATQIIGDSNTPRINSWNLSKIISPDGKQLVFTYKAPVDLGFTMGKGPKDSNIWVMNEVFQELKSADQVASTFLGSTFIGATGSSYSQDPYFSITKGSYLESISSENFTIKFIYFPKAQKFYTSNTVLSTFMGAYNQQNYELDQIQYLDKNQTILKLFDFVYAYDNTSTRLYLTTLLENGKNPYTFDYYNYNNGTLPLPETHGIDHWGYWNGGTSTTSSLVPSINYSTAPGGTGDEQITSTARDANPAVCMDGLLKTITYPTKGYSTFEYEGNDYSKRLQRTSATAFLPGIVTTSATAGGTRIKKISDFNGTGTENVREFKYLKNYITNPASTTSSGFLLDYPRYTYFWQIGSQMSLRIRSSGFHTNYNTSQNFINYSEVTEILNSQQYKVHKFSNYESNPDVQDYQEKDLDPSTTSSVVPAYLPLYKNLVGYQLNDRSWDRGKEIFTASYDINKTLVQSTTNVYDVFNPSTTNYAVGILPGTGTFAESYKIFEDVTRLNQTTSILVNGGQQATTVQNLTHDNYGQLSVKTTTSSKNESLATTYHYPYNMAPANDPNNVYPGMVTANDIAPVIEQINTRSGIQENFTRTTYYSPATNLYLPQFTQMQTRTTDPLETRENYSFDYLTGWNPQSIIKDNAPTTCYLWGYNKTYPTAQVSAAAYNQIAYSSCEEPFSITLPNENGSNITFSNITTSLFSTDCRTGLQSYNLTSGNTIYTTRALPTGTYVVSYWTKGTNALTFNNSYTYSGLINLPVNVKGWSYHQMTVVLPGAVSFVFSPASGGVATLVDDICIYPVGAQMTTYTYAPQVGMTSMTDSKGLATTYEYDSNQRLINVKDKDGNITKHYDYHYQNQ